VLLLALLVLLLVLLPLHYCLLVSPQQWYQLHHQQQQQQQQQQQRLVKVAPAALLLHQKIVHSQCQQQAGAPAAAAGTAEVACLQALAVRGVCRPRCQPHQPAAALALVAAAAAAAAAAAVVGLLQPLALAHCLGLHPPGVTLTHSAVSPAVAAAGVPLACYNMKSQLQLQLHLTRLHHSTPALLQHCGPNQQPQLARCPLLLLLLLPLPAMYRYRGHLHVESL
jgi:hypothetical protein